MIKTYKNFLNKKEMNHIYSNMTSPNFAWYLNEVLYDNKCTIDESYNIQLTHSFYLDDSINSKSFSLILPILKKLKYFTLVRVKANLLFKTDKIYEHGMHKDFVNEGTKIKTGIFYLNTNDGYTKFKDGTIIKSEQNKYIEFDSELEHTGSTCTDSKYRIVINFNYVA